MMHKLCDWIVCMNHDGNTKEEAQKIAEMFFEHGHFSEENQAFVLSFINTVYAA